MNVLFWIGLGLIVVLTVLFVYALMNGRGGMCLVCFILVVLLAATAVITNFLPPQKVTWTVTNITKKQVMTLFNESSNQSMSLPLKTVNHINAEYKTDDKVEIWQNIWGDVIYVAPAKWTVTGVK